MPMSRRTEAIVAAVLVLLAGWLVSPVLTAVPVEGYVAQLISLGAMFADGQGAGAYDRLFPLPMEFYYQTRFGVVMLIAAARRLGIGGDAALHMLVPVCWTVIVASSILFARRWLRIRPVAAAAALVLVPGLFQLAYHFNDNVISTAFAAAALVLVGRRGVWPAAAGGALWGAAVLCRVDAWMLAPAYGALILAAQGRRAMGAAAAAGAFALAAAGTIHAAGAFGGYDPQRALQVGSYFAQICGLSPFYHAFEHFASPVRALQEVIADVGRCGGEYAVQSLIIALFFGPSAPLVAIGAVLVGRGLLRRRRWRRFFALVAAPAMVSVAAAGEAMHVRYGFPLLAPYIALFGGAALSFAWKRRPKAVAVAAAVVVAMALVSPIELMESEGPQVFLGRLREPPLWRAWQRGMVDASFFLDDWLPRLSERDSVVITAHFNDDFLMRQHLVEGGWKVIDAKEAFGCDGIYAYVKDGRRIAHVRTEVFFLAWRSIAMDQALSCLGTDGRFAIWLTSWGNDAIHLTPAFYGHLAESFGSAPTMQARLLTQEEAAWLARQAAADAPKREEARIGTERYFRERPSLLPALNPRWPGSR